MSPSHPAVQLLFSNALALIVLMPLIAWFMLRGRRDTNARLWYAGAGCYAITAWLFTLQGKVPSWVSNGVGQVFAFAMVLLMIESLHRELGRLRSYWKEGLAFILLMVGLHWYLAALGLRESVARPLHLTVISALDIVVIFLLARVVRLHGSRALGVVILAFAAVVASNLLRVYHQIVFDEPVGLLDYTPLSNFSLIANIIGVILYSFGYWGFVLEKNWALEVRAAREIARARENEVIAQGIARETLELLKERDELIVQLASIGKMAQAGAVSAGIAHEINQPLASIRLTGEEVLEVLRKEGGSTRLLNLVQRIVNENGRAAATIESVKSVFRSRKHEGTSRSLDDVVRAMCELFRHRLADENLRVDVDCRAPEPVLASSGEIEHVILNLLSNAMDALRESCARERLIRVSTRQDHEKTVLRVSDNGPGVAPEIRPVMFDLLRTSKRDGLGIGLWLSRYIVEQHGGRIFEERSTGAGAAFVVELPTRLSMSPAA